VSDVRQRIWLLALAGLLAAFVLWLSPALAPYAGGSDSSGYLWSARLFRQGALSAPIDVPPGFPLDAVGPSAFAPLGARVRPGTLTLVPTYPTGLPLHLAAAGLLFTEENAVRAVLLLAAATTLWLLYLLGCDAGLRPPWALAGCVLLGSSPLFLFLAVQPFSDVLATCWAEAAVLCAWRTRRRLAWATLAGASLGIATLVRPTNLVMILPVMAAMPLATGALARLVAGGLPFAAFVAAYQAWAYGHPLVSGYGDVSSAFAWANVAPSLAHYAVWLPRLASWLVVCSPVAAWAWRGPLARWRLIAGAWMLAVFGTYAFYLLTSETWWYMRFVLPAFPPLIIAALIGLREVVRVVRERVHGARGASVAGVVAAVAIAACAFGLVQGPQFKDFRLVRFSERVYPEAVKLMAIERPARAPILMVQASGAANYYASGMRLLRFDALSPDAWQAIRKWQATSRTPIEAALFPFERDQLLLERRPLFPCGWEARGHFRQITFWECPP
jgi:4-amino-4-deoxy-L-arabinose transferase-like glycosyltransferase